MGRINIPFVVDRQSIRQLHKVKIASGGQNYFYATFDLCDIWNNIDDKKAVFRYGNKSFVVSLVNNNNCFECLIPWEVMAKVGFFDVGVFGGDRLPTSFARVFVIEGCVCEGEYPQPPTEDWFSAIEKRINDIPVIDDQIAMAVAKYIDDYINNNPNITSTSFINTVDLYADKWELDDDGRYSQIVTINGITPYSQVDLTPSAEQLTIFHDKDLAFVAENEDGIITVYAIGQKPLNDYTIQVTIEEVSV